MSKLTIAKFGGSAIGIDGEGIPDIVKRVKEIRNEGKLVVVCLSCSFHCRLLLGSFGMVLVG